MRKATWLFFLPINVKLEDSKLRKPVYLLHTDFHNQIQIQEIPEITSASENAIILNPVANRKNYLILKRAVDVIFSILFIVLVLTWLLPILAIWIKLDSGGPVFFLQSRIGRAGKLFRCIKLRTMIRNDDADEKPADENDVRITRAGRFLRKTNIDELPQFINVLKGDMSLTGPRPHMPSDCTRFSFVVASYQLRNLVKPGITGLAQIKGYRGPVKDYDSIVNRYHWDEVYVRRAALWLDLKIITTTMARCVQNFFAVTIRTVPNLWK